MAEVEDLSKLKLAELKNICKENGLPVTGNKSDLVQRIEELYQKDVDEDDLLGDSGNEDELLHDSTINEDVLESLELEGEQNIPKDPIRAGKRLITHPTDSSEEPLSKVSKDSVQSPSEGDIDKTSPKSQQEAISVVRDPKLSRAERFGVSTIDSTSDKKTARAERFGVPTSETIEVKKTARAERFGLPTNVSAASDEKKNARAQRFGIASADSSSSETKLATRAERFGISNASASTNVQLDVLKKREERFGEVVSPTLSKVESTQKKEARLQRFDEPNENSSSNSKFQATTISFGSSNPSEKKDDRAKRFGIPAS